MFVGYKSDYDVKILCDWCGTEGATFGSDDFKGDERQSWIDSAIAAWNSRTPAATVVGWRPIETAPKDGSVVLLVTDYGVVASAWDESTGYFGNDYVEYDCATLWAPMPAPPAGEG
jgi:hypothetical protein